MAKIKDIDYLFLSTRVRALESKLLTQEKMARMLEAPTSEDAAKVLQECGYPDLVPLNHTTLQEALAAEQRKAIEDVAAFAPDPALMDVFRIKYDYHNAKVILKSEATGAESGRLLMDLGRVPVGQLQEKMVASDLRGIPAILQGAIAQAREVLGTTQDPQLADLTLDRAYYEDMAQLAQTAQSDFLKGYVRISIDAANLRAAVRTLRMGRGTDFLKTVLFSGGNLDVQRVLSAAGAGGSLADLYALSPLKAAAEAGAEAIQGGRLTQFERLCDNAVNDYVKTAKYVAFGEAPVVAYLVAKENEITAIRILLTGKMAGLPAEIIQERLRDSYV